jgi:hypothetical protein
MRVNRNKRRRRKKKLQGERNIIIKHAHTKEM